MKAAELFITCPENEGVESIFGIPGKENLHVMDAICRFGSIGLWRRGNSLYLPRHAN